MVGGRGVRLAPDSVVRDSEFFVALDPRDDRRGKTREARVRMASAVKIEWLEELFPASLRRTRSVLFDEERQRVVGVNRLLYHDLVLREDPNAAVDAVETSLALAEALRPRVRSLISDDEAAATWMARFDLLKRAMPEHPWPDFDDHTLAQFLDDICQGKRTLEEIRSSSLVPVLEMRLTYSLNRLLEEHAPKVLTVPSGSRIRLTYEPGRPPILAVRLQELFGWTETPRIAAGRVPVVVHLLGPNFRPVQVTDDLRSFWSTTYFQVRKDLRARYPRHSWPDDPLSARPEAKGGRRS